METWHGGGGSPWRGDDGPVHVTRGPRTNPLFDAFISAGEQAGYPVTQDYNGTQQEGFGPMEATIWKGRRWSAANAYLRPALKTGRLRIVRALAERVAFDGNRATGVEVRRGGVTWTVRAAADVILAASPINTPKLLMLSGIGDAAHLAEHGIAVRADRPGVGANLQDHLEIYMQFTATQPVTLFKHWNMWGKGTHRRAMDGDRHGAGGVEPVRKLRLHPLARGRRHTPTSSTTSCRWRCAMTARSRRRGTGSRPMSGRCARPRAGRCG